MPRYDLNWYRELTLIFIKSKRYCGATPLAVVRFSSEFNNSDMFLIVTPGKFLLTNRSDVKDTWALVSQSTSIFWPLISFLTIHLFPTNPTTVACCWGVRWLKKVLLLGSALSCFALFDRYSIALRNSLCSCQCFFWQFRLQYFTAWHFEHCKNFAFSDWTFRQPLHRRDL